MHMLWVWMLAAAVYGNEACRSCHPAQVEQHRATRHARSLRPITTTEFWKNLPDGPIAEARNGYQLHYQRTDEGVRVLAERGPERLTAAIEWAFGAGAQGVTPLLRRGDRFYEHRISFYPPAGRFDLTLGHSPGPSASAEAALGIGQPRETLRQCLGCHASIEENNRSERTTAVRTPGVDCSRCHDGAERHATMQSPVGNPRRLSPQAEVALCAACHRLTPPGRANDPLNIRFQPLRLLRSACYEKGGVRCSTCHPAHQDRAQKAAFYRSRCLNCHPQQARKGDCLPCHMPRSSPAPYLTFTDHWIRAR